MEATAVQRPNQLSLEQLLEKIIDQPVKTIKHAFFIFGVQCNVRCAFCCQTSWSPEDNLPEHIIQEKIFPLLPHLPSFGFTGGEVTIMKSCQLMRDHLIETGNNARINITTNGIAFKDKWADFMLGREGMIQVSINGSCKDVYDRTVKYGNFEAVIQNVKAFMQRKKEAGTQYPTVRASFVVSETNMWDVFDFFKMVQELDLDGIYYLIDNRYKELPSITCLSDEDFDKYLAMIQKTIRSMENTKYKPEELVTLEYNLQKMQAQRAARA